MKVTLSPVFLGRFEATGTTKVLLLNSVDQLQKKAAWRVKPLNRDDRGGPNFRSRVTPPKAQLPTSNYSNEIKRQGKTRR